MHQKIVSHFQKVDPIIYRTINRIEPLEPVEISGNYFSDICEAIINQQLSDKAARTIFNKFKELFPKKIITAEILISIPDQNIRNVGPSWKKVSFIKDLALKLVSGKIKLNHLNRLTDEEVIIELTKIKGIGRWTAEMFLMFSLGREDVFSSGDLGLRRGIQKLYKLETEPTLEEIEKISNKWSPYRTFAARIIWRANDLRED
ncbi:MAG: DNA-3-methyladenine glycosylase II [Candidatus Gottesmanbacteria bacterium GW2011_GWC2_39_8]|uniref:DNA-3-methyladenine glycosylase II n=1 Tax=Candidatus Gottesmanbacteria bacterium GW2011_GWC2_39_8 TaxID=1618450 RepID=A0A0G0T844_9BACT|nr:MAG: DNA-3-methyladenine glycosylase II [Candidatus Gottesmanbacteria bacterium GW2011_GWC2_39_8]